MDKDTPTPRANSRVITAQVEDKITRRSQRNDNAENSMCLRSQTKSRRNRKNTKLSTGALPIWTLASHESAMLLYGPKGRS